MNQNQSFFHILFVRWWMVRGLSARSLFQSFQQSGRGENRFLIRFACWAWLLGVCVCGSKNREANTVSGWLWNSERVSLTNSPGPKKRWCSVSVCLPSGDWLRFIRSIAGAGEIELNIKSESLFGFGTCWGVRVHIQRTTSIMMKIVRSSHK